MKKLFIVVIMTMLCGCVANTKNIKIEDECKNSAVSLSKLLSEPLWTIDNDRINVIMESFLVSNKCVYIDIVETNKKSPSYYKVKKGYDFIRKQVNNLNDSYYLTSENIVYDAEGEDKKLGVVRVVFKE
jgi:hypothetical protein